MRTATSSSRIFAVREALDQALRVRGSREFSSRAAYERFVQELARNRNLTRTSRFQQEQAALHPLPPLPLAPCRELRVSVSRFSTIAVLGKRYSVRLPAHRRHCAGAPARRNSGGVRGNAPGADAATLAGSDSARGQLPPCHLEAFA